MNEISQPQNLEAHYTTSAKIEKPKHVVADGPDSIPKYHVYTDREANMKLSAIEKDIYESVEKAPKKSKKKKFLGIF